MSDIAVTMMPSDVWSAIENRGVRRSFATGEALTHHGASGTSCFAICSGTVLVTATSTQGATLVLGRRGVGDLVGEITALHGGQRSATVTAKSDVEVIVLQADELRELSRDHPEWAISLLEELAGRVRTLSERFALRSEDLQARLTAVLTTHLDETGDAVFRSTREELAGWVGATREAVIRSLRIMAEAGDVKLRRGAVELVDEVLLVRM